MGDRMLVWYGTGPFVQTSIARDEVPHNFPMAHSDYLTQTVKHRVITGKRMPADARAFYAKTAMAFKQGDKSSPYVQGLIFQSEPNSADPDRPHTM